MKVGPLRDTLSLVFLLGATFFLYMYPKQAIKSLLVLLVVILIFVLWCLLAGRIEGLDDE